MGGGGMAGHLMGEKGKEAEADPAAVAVAVAAVVAAVAVPVLAAAATVVAFAADIEAAPFVLALVPFIALELLLAMLFGDDAAGETML